MDSRLVNTSMHRVLSHVQKSLCTAASMHFAFCNQHPSFTFEIPVCPFSTSDSTRLMSCDQLIAFVMHWSLSYSTLKIMFLWQGIVSTVDSKARACVEPIAGFMTPGHCVTWTRKLCNTFVAFFNELWWQMTVLSILWRRINTLSSSSTSVTSRQVQQDPRSASPRSCPSWNDTCVLRNASLSRFLVIVPQSL